MISTSNKSTTTTGVAPQSGRFRSGVDLAVVRLGFGAMQMPGLGVRPLVLDRIDHFQSHCIERRVPLENQAAAAIRLTDDQCEALARAASNPA